jgi:hypothetical protein
MSAFLAFQIAPPEGERAEVLVISNFLSLLSDFLVHELNPQKWQRIWV